MRRAALALMIVCASSVAGCGSTTIRHVTETITRSSSATVTSQTSAGETTPGSATTSTATGTSTTSAHATGAPTVALARRRPQTILRLAVGALRHADGYAMRADLVQDRQRTIIDLSAQTTTRYEASTTTGKSMFQVIALAGRAYLKGDASFWRGQAGASAARAKAFAGHWLALPGAGAHSILHSLGTLAPGTLARCLGEDHGTLRVSGIRTVDHRRAVIVTDAGNAPGATPSTLAVAATGTPYPLRWDGTGRTRTGGRIDVCNNGKGDGATGTITLSQFGDTPSISAPTTSGSAPGSPT